jgi:hypothetical protein
LLEPHQQAALQVNDLLPEVRRYTAYQLAGVRVDGLQFALDPNESAGRVNRLSRSVRMGRLSAPVLNFSLQVASQPRHLLSQLLHTLELGTLA